MDKSKTNINSLIRTLPRGSDPKTVESIKDILTEIELFQKDIELSPSGRKYSIFDENSSPGYLKKKKVLKLDEKLFTDSENLTNATSILYDRSIEGPIKDIVKEINKMKKYLIDLKNTVSDRDNLLKGVK